MFLNTTDFLLELSLYVLIYYCSVQILMNVHSILQRVESRRCTENPVTDVSGHTNSERFTVGVSTDISHRIFSTTAEFYPL